MYDSAKNAVRFDPLCTAIDLEIHDFFEAPQTANEFSDISFTDSQLTEKFLNALVAIWGKFTT